MFVEVKCDYLYFKSSGNRKGYEKIIKTYLGKEIKFDNITLTEGTIISFSGFSPALEGKAKKDKIKLVGPEDVKQVFEENIRNDLIEKLDELTNSSL